MYILKAPTERAGCRAGPFQNRLHNQVYLNSSQLSRANVKKFSQCARKTPGQANRFEMSDGMSRHGRGKNGE